MSSSSSSELALIESADDEETGLDFALDDIDTEDTYIVGDLERQLFYESLKNSEIRHELLWSGPLGVISNFSDFIQIIVIARVVHLIIDLCPLVSDRWKDFTNCSAGLYLIHRFLSKAANRSDGDLLMGFAFSVIIYYLTAYCALKKFILFNGDRNRDYKPEYKLYLIGLATVTMPILTNEYLIHYQTKTHLTNLRSIFMTISMKVLSQIHGNLGNREPNLLGAFGYFLHPASCLFGPWHQYQITQVPPPLKARPRERIIGEFARQSIGTLFMFVLTLLVLLASESLLDLLDTFVSIELSGLNQISSVFFVAQKFRFSHYFMCYLSCSLLTLWHEPYGFSSIGCREICRITRVEWPRSLLEVAKFWNIPMSNWLKDHIFIPSRVITSDNGSAVLMTFTVSALFHGFKFNIWAVLLNLGLLTLIEHKVRERLALKLNACILAKRCSESLPSYKDKCVRGHARTESNSIAVFLINLLFRLVALAHLSYLGYIFQGNTDLNTYRDDIGLWSELYFYSPILAIVTLLFGAML